MDRKARSEKHIVDPHVSLDSLSTKYCSYLLKLISICDSPWENREKGERTGTLK